MTDLGGQFVRICRTYKCMASFSKRHPASRFAHYLPRLTFKEIQVEILGARDYIGKVPFTGKDSGRQSGCARKG
jgi:hypothetical protein